VRRNLSKNPVIPLQADSLAQIPWLVHGFSTRLGGFSQVYGGNTLNLGFTKEDSRSAVERNRAAFLNALDTMDNGRRWLLVTLRQIHSSIIHCVSSLPSTQLAGDGLITRTPKILLGIQTADCIPVILVDRKRKAIGIFHAGWRGTLNRIVEKGVGEMRRWFGTMPRDIMAAIGPGIGGCCYRVGVEVRQEFESQFTYANDLFRETRESDQVREKYPMLFLSARAPGHSDLPRNIFLDLAESNRRQLVSIGVPAKNITVSPVCTVCRVDLLFSHRAEKGMTGRMLCIAGIKAGPN
jgi:YfiH family protein